MIYCDYWSLEASFSDHDVFHSSETVLHYRCYNFSSESDWPGNCKSKSWLPSGNLPACKHNEMSEMKASEWENEFEAFHWSLFSFYSLAQQLEGTAGEDRLIPSD